jgi:protein SCO1/2
MRSVILLLFSAVLLASCQYGTVEKPRYPANEKRYKLTGKVVAVDPAKKKATVDHDEIKGFMKPMTMEFPIKADWVWEDLKAGSEIRAELVVDETQPEPYWLENIGIISAADPSKPVPVDDRFASVGKEIIDFTLTNQDGKKVSPRDFRGKAWAITFIYAQCPLPDYCIRMSTNFSDAAIQVRDSEFKDQMALLSISFDPERDTPAKLRQYGQGYLGKDAKPDFNVWQLAVGSDKEVRPVADFFGLRYEVDANDKTQFNHSLRTAVIGPDGKVVKVLSGNDWTPADLLNEMRSALGK